MEIDSKYHIPDEHKKVLKMLLEKTSEAMDSLKITYFIDGGTLLGAVRHKDLIPYDDDIDIGTFYPDFPKLAMLLSQQIKAHEKYEIKIQQSDVMIKVYVSDMWEQSKDGKIIGTYYRHGPKFNWSINGNYDNNGNVKMHVNVPLGLDFDLEGKITQK